MRMEMRGQLGTQFCLLTLCVLGLKPRSPGLVVGIVTGSPILPALLGVGGKRMGPRYLLKLELAQKSVWIRLTLDL